jgi:hypothetical protein
MSEDKWLFRLREWHQKDYPNEEVDFWRVYKPWLALSFSAFVVGELSHLPELCERRFDWLVLGQMIPMNPAASGRPSKIERLHQLFKTSPSKHVLFETREVHRLLSSLPLGAEFIDRARFHSAQRLQALPNPSPPKSFGGKLNSQNTEFRLALGDGEYIVIAQNSRDAWDEESWTALGFGSATYGLPFKFQFDVPMPSADGRTEKDKTNQSGMVVASDEPNPVVEILKTQQGCPMSLNMLVPNRWDEGAITRQLSQLRAERPGLIPHFIESITERFVVRQDDQTAQARIRFLTSQIQQLKLAKEFQQTVDDLQLLTLEKAKRIKSIELETEELDIKKRVLSQKERLEALREQKKMELEIAQLEQQIEELKNPAQPEARPTPEQLRARRHAASEERLQLLKGLKREALKISDEDERIQKVNAIDDEVEREMEEWRKSL